MRTTSKVVGITVGGATAVLLALTPALTPAQAAAPVRPTPPATAVVAGGAASAVGGGVVAGAVLPGARTVSVTIDLAFADPAGAAARALVVSTPGSPAYGHYLTSAAFDARYGPRPAAVTALRGWLGGRGLTVDEAIGDQALVVHGRAGAVSTAFGGVALRVATAHGATGVVAVGALRVPTAVAAAIDSVGGLSGPAAQVSTYSSVTDHHPRVAAAPATAAASGTTAAGTTAAGTAASPTPPCATFFGQVKAAAPTPLPFRARAVSAPECSLFRGPAGGYVTGASNAKIRALQGPIPKAAGRGRTIGIVLWGNDPTARQAANQQAAANGDNRLRNGQYTTVLSTAHHAGCQPAGADASLEQDLDIQAVRVSATAADIRYYANTRCVVPELSLATAVEQNRVQVLSNSYGYPNLEYDPADRRGADFATGDITHKALLKAAVEGITVLFATGDSGSGVLAGNSRTGSPGYPATDPYAVAVGGVGFATGAKGGIAFRSGWTNGFYLRSGARWHRLDPVAVGGANSVGSSGGVSAYWAAPSWQRQAGVAVRGRRVVPDISNLADGYFDPFVVYQVTQGLETVGGTSVAAPLTAGLVGAALTVEHRTRVGLITPALYARRRGGAVDDVFFRQDAVSQTVDGDVLLIGSEVPQEGLKSKAGWDDVTGLGAPGPRFTRLLH